MATEDWKNLSDTIRGQTQDYLNVTLGVPKQMMELEAQGMGLKRERAKQAMYDQPLTVDFVSNVVDEQTKHLPPGVKQQAVAGTGGAFKTLGWKISDDGKHYLDSKGQQLTLFDFGQAAPVFIGFAINATNPMSYMTEKRAEIEASNDPPEKKKADIAKLDQGMKYYQERPEEFLLGRTKSLNSLRGIVKTAGGDTSIVDTLITDTHKSLDKFLEQRAVKENWQPITKEVAKYSGLKEGTKVPADTLGHLGQAVINMKGHLGAANITAEKQKEIMGQGQVFAAWAGIIEKVGSEYEKSHRNANQQPVIYDAEGNTKIITEEAFNTGKQAAVNEALATYNQQLVSTVAGKKMLGGGGGGTPTTPTQPKSPMKAEFHKEYQTKATEVANLVAELGDKLTPKESMNLGRRLSAAKQRFSTNPAAAVGTINQVIAALKEKKASKGPGLRMKDETDSAAIAF